ncbi:MAG TPA: DUF5946 family protein [Pyrinomonadaceae bacterium]|nr:DUF5946 family protein [Pyrinomonadaceae bacterium]
MNHDALQEKFYELSYYTLAHPDPAFIHQHIVDAFTAQTADQDSKPIAVAFALIGLCLYLEKNYTGKQVQLAHMTLARRKREWPTFDLPNARGEITVADVLNEPAGPTRDAKIRDWCASVWQAYSGSHQKVLDLISIT